MLPLFPVDPAAPAGLDLQVTLRDHTDRERHGNKIIEWFFGAGRNNTKQTGLTLKPLRWKLGDPVRISLRFADQSPLVPVASPALPWLTVQGRTANIRIDGPWAALDLVNLLRSTEVSAESGGGQALEIRIPLAPAGQQGSTATDEAVVYITLALSEPGKTTPLRWPSGFPAKLPETLTQALNP
jgi:type VI secretion system protein ImpL